jgi:hypothetical protein
MNGNLEGLPAGTSSFVVTFANEIATSRQVVEQGPSQAGTTRAQARSRLRDLSAHAAAIARALGDVDVHYRRSTSSSPELLPDHIEQELTDLWSVLLLVEEELHARFAPRVELTAAGDSTPLGDRVDLAVGLCTEGKRHAQEGRYLFARGASATEQLGGFRIRDDAVAALQQLATTFFAIRDTLAAMAELPPSDAEDEPA